MPSKMTEAERLERQKLADRAFDLRGYQGDRKEVHAREDKKRAGAQPRILTPDDIKGDYDASRVLETTIGAEKRPIDLDDLIAFKKNIATVKETVAKLNKGRFQGGMTPQQVINLSTSKDLERANEQIPHSAIVSRKGPLYHFVTNAWAESEDVRHHVNVEFLNWGAAVASPQPAAKMARELLCNGAIRFECDCGRFKYWYRFVATIAGVCLGRQETGYPKIKNPHLVGIGCKHILRTMTVIKSPVIAAKLAHDLQWARDNGGNRKEADRRKEVLAQIEELTRTAHHKRSQVRALERAKKVSAGRQTAQQKLVEAARQKAAGIEPAKRQQTIQALQAMIAGAAGLLEVNAMSQQEYNLKVAEYTSLLHAIQQLSLSTTP